MKRYSIPIRGIGLGKHEFNFKIDSRFFQYFENSEIKEGNLTGNVMVDKKPQVIELNFLIRGVVNIACDRCLEYFDFPVQYSSTVYAKFGNETDKVTDDIIIISNTDQEINVSQLLYDFICLSLPYRRIHPNDKNGESLCNKEMLSILKDFLVRNETKKDRDPRWTELKKLKL
jgi:uncharacterized protein